LNIEIFVYLMMSSSGPLV